MLSVEPVLTAEGYWGLRTFTALKKFRKQAISNKGSMNQKKATRYVRMQFELVAECWSNGVLE